MTARRRVVITGLGLVTPLGAAPGRANVDRIWKRVLAGDVATVAADFGMDDVPSRVAGLVPRSGDGAFEAADHGLTPGDISMMPDFMQFGVAAAEAALADAGWADLLAAAGVELPSSTASQAAGAPPSPEAAALMERAGVVFGSGTGSLETIIDSAAVLDGPRGYRRTSPYFVPRILINLISGHVSIRNGLAGPNSAVSTACASGAHAIGDAATLIALDRADLVVAGGSESSLTPISVAGFARARALSTAFNDTPEMASRPFDAARDGFVIGEGAGAVVVEELEHALARGARIYAEVCGYGLSGDAHHITSPPEDGAGAQRAMRMAIRESGLDVSEVAYVNAHGTSTPRGDAVEAAAIEAVLGGRADRGSAGAVAVSSVKGAIGHLLGGAGGVEAVITALAVAHETLPPTANLTNPDVGDGLDLIRGAGGRAAPGLVAALTNSFGFGGTNASLLLRTARDLGL